MLELIRTKKTKQSIMGYLNHNNELLCYTLENVLKAIPAGTYKLDITYSPKFKRNMPEILNVPDRTGIRIHTGNIPTDSDGCILVGDRELGIDDLIIRSKLTFDRIFPILENEKEITIKENI